MRAATILSLAASVAPALAVYKGFNYGSTFTDGSSKAQADYENEFNAAKGLVGTSGFTSARLYTMIQGGTTDTVTSAIPAAISSETTLLLGLWASAGQSDFDNELTALTNAIDQYGESFSKLVAGISVGSEDLYRISPTGIAALSGAGAEPSDLVNFITQVRNAIKGTTLSAAPVGHVDTWTAWVNGSNDAVTSACDFVGMDAYPYFQNTMSNGIEDGASLFASALAQTKAAAGSIPVWVTETGWPVSGKTENLGVPSLDNAKTYWDAVGCDSLFDNVNTWWYTLQDAYPTTPNPSFGVVGTTLSTTPLYNLSCSAGSSSSSSAVSSATSVSSSVAAATNPTTVPVSATSSVSLNPVPSASLGESTTGVAASGSASATAASGSVTASGTAIGSYIASGYGASATEASSVSVTAITTGSSTSVVEGATLTIWETTLATITSCSTVCTTTSGAVAGSAPASSASAPASSAPASSASATAASSASASASATSSACAANLSGSYQYPHLIVPVSSSSPSTAYGTQYNATINSTVSSIFNFDIPESYAGKTCSLVFLFPEQSQLETSAYSFNNQGGIIATSLSTAATTSTTYSSAGASTANGEISSLVSGNSYVISTESCPAGKTETFELSASGGLELEFFEDYNPSPLGLYVVAC